MNANNMIDQITTAVKDPASGIRTLMQTLNPKPASERATSPGQVSLDQVL